MTPMLTFYEFTEEDLASNRRGFITPRQKEWINGVARGYQSAQKSMLPVMGFFILLGGGITFGMIFANESMRNAFLSQPINLAAVCASATLLAAIILGSQFFGRRNAQKLRKADLKLAEGVIEWDEESSDTGSTYLLYVGETEFKFGEDLSRLFPKGKPGRVFYCENSFVKLILSHELLD
jgi:hypothetical protein